MQKQNQNEKIYDGLFKLSQIMDIKGVQKFESKQTKIFFYKLYGAYCEKKRKIITQKLVINSSASVKKYLWMIQQFYLNNKKKDLFSQKHIELAYQLNRIFRVSSRQRLNQAMKNIKGDKINFFQILKNFCDKQKLNQAHKMKEFILQYKQQYDDILKFRLCYFLNNLFEKSKKNNFGVFRYLSLNKNNNFKKEYIFQELKNRQQKKMFICFLSLLNNRNRFQKLKYFLSNFSIIYQNKQQERLRQAYIEIQNTSQLKLKSKNDSQQKTYSLQKFQEVIDQKKKFFYRIFFNNLKQNLLSPKNKQIGLYMMKISLNDKLSYCFYRLKQNTRLQGQKYFPLIFVLNKNYEKTMRNSFEKILRKCKIQKYNEKNKKSSATNINLILQKIFFQNKMNSKIKAMNELKKKIKKPTYFQPSKQTSVQNTIKVSNIQKQIIKKNKALKFFAFQRWKQFKNGAIQNHFSLNKKLKHKLRQAQMNQQIEKKINFMCNTERLENLLKVMIKIRKISVLRLLRQKRKQRQQKIQQNSCIILAKQMKMLRNKNLRLNLHRIKLLKN